MKEYLPLLKNLPLFDRIQADELMPLLKCLGGVQKTHGKGEYLICEDSPVRAMGIVLKGEVQVLQEDVWGNRAIIAAFRQGGIFGETLAGAGVMRSPVSVVAKERCAVLYIPLNPLVTPCSNACAFHGRLVENFLKIISQKNLQLNQKIKILSCRSTRDKLMAFFGSQMRQKGPNFTLPFNREELADFLCVNRSALSRELGRMKREGLIDFHGRHFQMISKKLDT